MTENEAKKWMNTLKNWNSILPEAQEACEMAEKALEETKAEMRKKYEVEQGVIYENITNMMKIKQRKRNQV